METPPGNQRRTFIKALGLLTVSVMGRPLVAKAALLKKIFPASNTWPEIVDYARWCPTVHNMQPHRVKILSADEAVLYCDTSRLLPVEDPECKFVTVALGIFIEHLSIAAGFYNNKVDFELLHDITLADKGVVAFARLKLAPSAEKETLNRDLIMQRRTSRLHYDGSPVSSDIISSLQNEAAAFNHHLYATDDQELVSFIIDQNQKTLFEDLESGAVRGELNGLFRYDREEAGTKKDGLWSACMNFPGWLMRSVFQHHEKWDHGLKKTLIKDFYKASFHGTATLGWFTGDFGNTAQWVNAGRMLARNWLFLTSRNIYIQPFGSLITNADAYKMMNDKLNITGDKKLWMIFRMGHSKEPARSYRLDLKDLLI
ncbi:MAG TPA: hypothetical protein VG367_12785 [Mucilaginibacter sp.]|jgi:hypothetical protein|nr:hypothetical protein [Mucilaginibacter sp.]